MSLRFPFLHHVPLEESAADTIVHSRVLFGQYTCDITCLHIYLSGFRIVIVGAALLTCSVCNQEPSAFRYTSLPGLISC